jgi:thioredoxin-like negative regulator of GroEL
MRCTGTAREIEPCARKEADLIAISGLEAFQSEVIGSPGSFLVDFWGPSCAPCVDLNRALEELEDVYRGRLIFVKVNADVEMDIAVEFGVRGLPTIFLVQDGQIKQRWIGKISGASLRSQLDKALGL